jgi:hypothetical protein
MKLRPLLAALACAAAASATAAEPPPTLRDSGFDDAPRVAFSPQYPLWSDGADKQRWIALPDGATVDASRPDAWDFPRGTRLWKTFSHAGRPVETRSIERAADGTWRYAAYVWRADGSGADLAPPRGVTLDVAGAPGGRYRVPGRGDCVACHAGATVPVLGFSALQLAGDGGRELRALVERGVVRALPPASLDTPPRVVAGSPLERAALGYLHGNCAHCHHPNAGRVPVQLDLMQRADPAAGRSADVLRTLLDAPSRWRAPGDDDARVVVPGRAAQSALVQRMATREPRAQMPPLGSAHVDRDALALLARWIDDDLPSRHKETSR